MEYSKKLVAVIVREVVQVCSDLTRIPIDEMEVYSRLDSKDFPNTSYVRMVTAPSSSSRSKSPEQAGPIAGFCIRKLRGKQEWCGSDVSPGQEYCEKCLGMTSVQRILMKKNGTASTVAKPAPVKRSRAKNNVPGEIPSSFSVSEAWGGNGIMSQRIGFGSGGGSSVFDSVSVPPVGVPPPVGLPPVGVSPPVGLPSVKPAEVPPVGVSPPVDLPSVKPVETPSETVASQIAPPPVGLQGFSFGTQ